MSKILSFYRSALGKKAVMAVTGIIFWGFVLAHMIGNLKIFEGAEGLNHYAAYLREMLTPLVPETGLLWILRIVLLVALVLHVYSTIALTRMNRAARPVGYERRNVVQAGFAERTMRWSGFAILAFLIYHILHFTTGTLHRNFQGHEGGEFHVYENVTYAFQTWWVLAIYLLAAALVGMHLYHGLWSLFQSLGWNHPRYNPLRRKFAVIFSLLISIGFAVPPLLVWTGVIR